MKGILLLHGLKDSDKKTYNIVDCIVKPIKVSSCEKATTLRVVLLLISKLDSKVAFLCCISVSRKYSSIKMTITNKTDKKIQLNFNPLLAH